MNSYKELFKRGRIGNMELRNRLVMPPMVQNYGNDGYVTERTKDYYEERASGGAGMVTIEANTVEAPRGWYSKGWLRIDDDKFIPGLQELVEAIHKHDARVVQEIFHPGREAKSKFTGCQPIAPSPIPSPGGEIPHEMTLAEIREITDRFAEAADRAKRIGFDGVEIHGGHGYLLAQFLMPSANQRKDEYGGNLQNRSRFMLEVVKAIRKTVVDYSVRCRINGEEAGAMGFFSPYELQQLARMLQESGADAIHISGIPSCRPYFSPPGGFVHSAAVVKRAVSIPVIVTGMISPDLGEQILKQGKADFIGMGRGLIADPHLPNKLASGKPGDIVPCIRCLECYKRVAATDEPVCCTVNASSGKEREYRITPAEKKKRVLIVGGGPAGLEAARVAALRGHDVTIYDKEHQLGGAMPAVAVIRGPDSEDTVLALTRYFKAQIMKLGIKVRLGKEVDEALIKKVMPDVVILGMGGITTIPDIAGIKNPIVLSQSGLHRMVKRYLRIFNPGVLRWLTNFYLPVGKRVVIIGGGVQGLELAEFLISRGRKVTVTDTADELGAELAPQTRILLLDRLTEQGCLLLSGVKYEEITDKRLSLVTREGKRQTIEADAILPASRLRPNTDLFESLKEKVPEVYLIGDAREPHMMMEAISEGSKTGLAI